MNSELLQVEVETQELPKRSPSLNSDTFDLAWLRLLRAVVRCRAPAGTDGDQPDPPSCSSAQPDRIFLRSWSGVLDRAKEEDNPLKGGRSRGDFIHDTIRAIAAREFGAEGKGWTLVECSVKHGWHLNVHDVDDDRDVVRWRWDAEKKKGCAAKLGKCARSFQVRVAQFRPQLIDALLEAEDEALECVVLRCFVERPVVVGDARSATTRALRQLFKPVSDI